MCFCMNLWKMISKIFINDDLFALKSCLWFLWGMYKVYSAGKIYFTFNIFLRFFFKKNDHFKSGKMQQILQHFLVLHISVKYKKILSLTYTEIYTRKFQYSKLLLWTLMLFHTQYAMPSVISLKVLPTKVTVLGPTTVL